MTSFLALRHILCGLAILGLLLAPVVQPATGADSQPAMTSDSMDPVHSAGQDEEMAMPDGMPCCPDQAPAADCGKHCPLMALCMAQFFPNAPAWDGSLVRLSLRSVVIPSDDPELSGQLHGPPPRPPRTSI